MKNLHSPLSLFAVLIILGVVSVFGQTGTFSDVNADYTFEIPDAKWKMTSKPSAASPGVEFVFVERNEGHVEVRKLAAGKNALLTDVIRDEEQKLQFLPGYVTGKEENFVGYLKGSVFNFEYVKAGRPMSGRFYFLRSGDGSVYVVRVTGFRDKVRVLKSQTDSIARTFNVRSKK